MIPKPGGLAASGPEMVEVNGTPTGIVFLSGGTALQGLARFLAARGDHASHVISVFDTGGSAGRLRDVCTGIAIGDIRKRLTAIGDREAPASRPLVDLFASRLPNDEPVHWVRRRVEKAAQGQGELLEGLNGSSHEIAETFARVLEAVPDGFDWCDGSIGNLILSGRYLREGDWGGALRWAHRRLATCGYVLPVSTSGADLGARLANGRRVVGQAAITSQSEPIEAPIEEIFLQKSDEDGEPARVDPSPAVLDELRAARAIVYSWGSFYTSVLPSLLVEDVGETICDSDVPKVLLLNPVRDSETQGKKPADLVREIRRYAGAGDRSGGAALTHAIALRLPNGESFYRASDRAEMEAEGVEVIEIESPGLPGEAELRCVAAELMALAE